MSNITKRERLLASSILAGVAAFSTLAGAAVSQTLPAPSTSPVPAPDASGAAVQEVVVTGSRITRRDFVADSPIVSVSAKAIENTGAVTLDRLINQIPQFVPGLGSQNNNPGNGQVNIQLRGLGSTRTLVLIDGRRTTPSNVSGVVDINSIPDSLIDSIETITGGASAAYGSDAIGGVVNFKLKHNFTGAQIDSQFGISEHGDGQETATHILLGSNFAEDRGNAVMAFSYDNRDAVFYGGRPQVLVNGVPQLAISGASNTIPQGKVTAYTTTANQPTQAALDSVFAKYGVAAGSIQRNFALGFNQDGTLFNGPANYKGPTSIDFSTIPTTGLSSGGGLYNTGALNYIQLPQTRYQAYTALEYAITPHVKAYGTFNFTDYTSSTQLAPSPASGNPSVGGTGFLVPGSNPFIPADLKTILNSRPSPLAPFIFNKRFSELGARVSNQEYTTYQFVTGLKGDLPGHDITYDIYGAYGHLNEIENQSGNVSHANVRTLLESPTGSAGSCTGYNPFGQNGISAACAAYISPTTKNQTQYTQKIVEATAQGHLFTMPTVFEGVGGGDVRFAVGADYRSDQAQFQPDALLSSQDISSNVINGFTLTNNTSGVVGFNGGLPVKGTIDVYEVYGELLVPIFKDLPLIKRLDLDLSARESDYSTIGAAFTYKADMTWKITSWLSARGGYSRAIRAPNVGELYTPASNGFYDIGAAGPAASGDPCDIRGAYIQGANQAKVVAQCIQQGVPANQLTAAQIALAASNPKAPNSGYEFSNTQVQELGGGNPNLHQERANTYSGGFIIAPHFGMPMFSRLTASIDYYNIEINGFVGAVGPSTQLTKCFNADGSNPGYTNSYALCGLFTRDPATGNIVSGSAQNQNLGAIRTSGVDFQVDWAFALSSIPYANLSDRYGSVAFNLVTSWLNDFDVQTLPGGQFQNSRDSISSGPGGSFPVWKALLNSSYSVGPVEVGVVERYIGSARDSSCVGITSVCTAQGVDPTFYTDLNVRWKINDNLELLSGITNLGDQNPRFFSSGSASQGGTDASTYDLIGRRYFTKLKARF